MALKATGMVISLKTKLLMVGDSVMGSFLQAPRDGDASPGAVYKLVRVVRAISPAREGIIWPLDSLILSYQVGVPYYPERCPKKETFLVKAPLFEPLSHFARL
jgi:hypothetical protein